MEWLRWYNIGPQRSLIQGMVDFFWNVGAPQMEIDKLNDVGGLINPLDIGGWIEGSQRGGMDGGWLFPVVTQLADALTVVDDSQTKTDIENFLKAHNFNTLCLIGRDMGASPPRQTEFRFGFLKPPLVTLSNALKAKCTQQDLLKQLDILESLRTTIHVPPFPDGFIDFLKNSNYGPLEFSVTMSSAGPVQLGVSVGNTGSVNAIKAFAEVMKQDASKLLEFWDPSIMILLGVDLVYLCPAFGYGVYPEGWNLMAQFKACDEFHHGYELSSFWPQSHDCLPDIVKQSILSLYILRSKSLLNIPIELFENISKFIINISYLLKVGSPSMVPNVVQVVEL